MTTSGAWAGLPLQPGHDGVEGPQGAGGVVVGVQVHAEGTPPGGVQARVVDLVEEMLEGAGEVAEVDGASEQVAVRVQYVDGRGGQGRVAPPPRPR